MQPPPPPPEFGTPTPVTSQPPGVFPQRTDHPFGFEASPTLGPSERGDPMKHKKKLPPLEHPQANGHPPSTIRRIFETWIVDIVVRI
eukprot:5506731-Prorocentrum_lima.AAC.1